MAQAGSTDNKKSLTDPKWQPSGWRIEQKYSKGVLIGNWSEDRLGKVSGSVLYICSVYYQEMPHSIQHSSLTCRPGGK